MTPDRPLIAKPQNRQELKVACAEEIDYRAGWIDSEPVERLAQPVLKNGDGKSLMKLLGEWAF